MKLKEAFAKKAYGRKRLMPNRLSQGKYGAAEFTYVVYEYHTSSEIYDEVVNTDNFEKALEDWPPYKQYDEAQLNWGWGHSNTVTLEAQLPGSVTLDQFRQHVESVIKATLEEIEDQRDY